MNSRRWWAFLRLQFIHRRQYPLPHRLAVDVPSFQHFIGPHGRIDWGVLTVLFDEFVGGAVDVEFGGCF